MTKGWLLLRVKMTCISLVGGCCVPNKGKGERKGEEGGKRGEKGKA